MEIGKILQMALPLITQLIGSKGEGGGGLDLSKILGDNQSQISSILGQLGSNGSLDTILKQLGVNVSGGTISPVVAPGSITGLDSLLTSLVGVAKGDSAALKALEARVAALEAKVNKV